jgi:hypothetical protein
MAVEAAMLSHLNSAGSHSLFDIRRVWPLLGDAMPQQAQK